MNEKMNEEQFAAHVAEVLPRRIKFIKEAAKEGRLIKIEQESGNRMVKCPKCGHSNVEIERKEEAEGGKKEIMFGGILAITFVVKGKEKVVKG